MVSKKIAIIIGIFILLLVIGSIGLWLYFSTLFINNSGGSSNTIGSSACSNLQNEVNTLQSELQQDQNIINLQESQIIENDYTVNQPASQYSGISFYAQYAGYVIVDVQSSTTTKTQVYIVENTNNAGQIVSQTYNIGSSGIVYFPVLPGQVTVYIGNSNFINGASETVTITYIY